MNNIGEKYLPIGTVVMLNGGTKRLMITGFCSIANDNPNVMYDYTGVLYPEGLLSSDQTAMFNHDQIAQIYYMGYADQEETAFKAQLKTVLAKTNTMMPGALNQAPSPQLTPTVAPQTVETTEPKEAPVPPIGPGLPNS